MYASSPKVRELLFSKVSTHLGKYLCPRTEKLSSFTLQKMWQLKKQVLFFVSYSLEKKIPMFAWSSQKSIISPYNSDIFTEHSKWLGFLSKEYAKKRPQNAFYVTQGIMEPHWMEIVAGQAVNGSLKAWISETATVSLVKWLKTRHRGSRGINIVIADFVEDNDFIPTVLRLNKAAIN